MPLVVSGVFKSFPSLVFLALGRLEASALRSFRFQSFELAVACVANYS
jgi:hypothetical protein